MTEAFTTITINDRKVNICKIKEGDEVGYELSEDIRINEWEIKRKISYFHNGRYPHDYKNTIYFNIESPDGKNLKIPESFIYRGCDTERSEISKRIEILCKDKVFTFNSLDSFLTYKNEYSSLAEKIYWKLKVINDKGNSGFKNLGGGWSTSIKIDGGYVVNLRIQNLATTLIISTDFKKVNINPEQPDEDCRHWIKIDQNNWTRVKGFHYRDSELTLNQLSQIYNFIKDE